MSARGIRNNNPGNIRYDKAGLFAGWTGTDADGFAVFDTPEHGIAAIGQNLRAYRYQHGLKTVDSIIRRWSATDQEAYVRNVSRALGVQPYDVMDIEDPTILRRLVVAIITQENAEQPYSLEMIVGALGLTVEHIDVQPAAPIEERGVPASQEDRQRVNVGGADNSNAVTYGATTGGHVPAILAALIPSVLAMFQPLAAEKIARITHQPQPIAEQFTTSLFNKIHELTGEADPIDAVAALRRDPDKVQAAQEHALQLAATLAPVIDQIAKHEEAARAAESAAMDAAGSRGRADKVDIAPRLVTQGDRHFLIALLMCGTGLAVQMYFTPDHKPDSGLLAFFGVLVYAVARNTESPFRYRFGRQYESTAADMGTQLVASTTTTTTKGKP